MLNVSLSDNLQGLFVFLLQEKSNIPPGNLELLSLKTVFMRPPDGSKIRKPPIRHMPALILH